MSADEIQTRLIDLDRLARETDRVEREILRKARDRLRQLSDKPGSEPEELLLTEVIHKAQAVLGTSSLPSTQRHSDSPCQTCQRD
ncbi:hypothetical protein [uncultured Pseudomonas sp.]|uniref:hypothetical protein n=1 Tax=uncultured Pseudomonas sp. TaxID=114707 RepID=UPI0026248B27|nr:hypothetical protein [uncultured Pseudomonas sp.]